MSFPTLEVLTRTLWADMAFRLYRAGAILDLDLGDY